MQDQMQGQPEQQGAQGQGGAPKSLPTDILVGMQALGKALQEGGAPQEILQGLSEVMAGYQSILQMISGGGGGGGQREMNPEGMPSSPAMR